MATVVVVGIAVGKTFTLEIAKDARVTDTNHMTTRESVVVTDRGFAVYTLSGDSVHHPECTKANRCFGVWPPVKASSAKNVSKAPGINGKLGVWHRNGFFQVTLGGHPLYTFAGDSQRDAATGEGIRSFGGTWHVIKTGGTRSAGTPTPMTTTPTTTTITTTPYGPSY